MTGPRSMRRTVRWPSPPCRSTWRRRPRTHPSRAPPLSVARAPPPLRTSDNKRHLNAIGTIKKPMIYKPIHISVVYINRIPSARTDYYCQGLVLSVLCSPPWSELLFSNIIVSNGSMNVYHPHLVIPCACARTTSAPSGASAPATRTTQHSPTTTSRRLQSNLGPSLGTLYCYWKSDT